MAFKRLAALSLTSALLACASAQAPAGCSGTPNNFPIWTGQPTLINKVANGLKFAANGNVTPPVLLVHVYGTPYEMGFAYGQLLSNEISLLATQTMNYFESMLNNTIPDWVPENLRDLIVEHGLDYAMNITYEATKPFTPAHHYETLQGVADGAGMPFWNVTRLSMIPEVTKAACSIITAWGQATSSGQPVHLRALDWQTGTPLQQFPLLATFHPQQGNGVPFTTLGWPGLMGSITGMSSSGMGVGEKVWYEYTGVQNIFGYVWNFLLQDILQYDGDIDAALSRIATANRTCAIWVSLSNKLANAGKVVQYSNQLVNFFNDKNYPAYPNHDLFTDLIFVDKHVQPSANPCFNNLMHQYYGKLDGPTIAQFVTSQEQTGDMHIAIMDWAQQFMYVSNAGIANAAGSATPAYNRPFLRFNMTSLWSTSMSNYA